MMNNNNNFDEIFTSSSTNTTDTYDVSTSINDEGSRLLKKWRNQHPSPYRGDSVYVHPKKSSLF